MIQDIIDSVMSSMQKAIEDAIIAWLTDLVDMFISFLQENLFNYDGLAGYAERYYELMVLLGSLLLLVLCLGKVIVQLLSEAEGSQEANIWWTIVATVKAGSLLVIMPFVIWFSMNQVVLPLGQYIIGDLATINEQMIEDLISGNLGGIIDSGIQIAGVWLIMLIVIGFYVVKISLAQAQLMMAEILSAVVCVTLVTDKYNFVEDWWKDIIMHTVTIVTLTMTMALFASAVVASETADGWGSTIGELPLVIGTGALVITGPTLIKKIWYKSGVGRSGSALAMKAIMLAK